MSPNSVQLEPRLMKSQIGLVPVVLSQSDTVDTICNGISSKIEPSKGPFFHLRFTEAHIREKHDTNQNATTTTTTTTRLLYLLSGDKLNQVAFGVVAFVS